MNAISEKYVNILYFCSLQKLSEESHTVQPRIPEAAILVFKCSKPDMTLKISLTSMQIKSKEPEEGQGNDGIHV